MLIEIMSHKKYKSRGGLQLIESAWPKSTTLSIVNFQEDGSCSSKVGDEAG